MIIYYEPLLDEELSDEERMGAVYNKLMEIHNELITREEIKTTPTFEEITEEGEIPEAHLYEKGGPDDL